MIDLFDLLPPEAEEHSIGNRGRGEDGTNLADQLVLGPQASCLVNKVLHFRRHVAVARRGAEDDRIRLGKQHRHFGAFKLKAGIFDRLMNQGTWGNRSNLDHILMVGLNYAR